jgi:hypothetical protein
MSTTCAKSKKWRRVLPRSNVFRVSINIGLASLDQLSALKFCLRPIYGQRCLMHGWP